MRTLMGSHPQGTYYRAAVKQVGYANWRRLLQERRSRVARCGCLAHGEGLHLLPGGNFPCRAGPGTQPEQRLQSQKGHGLKDLDTLCDLEGST